MSMYTVTVGEKSYRVAVQSRLGNRLTFIIDGKEYTTTVETAVDASVRQVVNTTGAVPRPAPTTPLSRVAPAAGSPLEIRAPMPGVVSEIKVTPDQGVQAGETLIVIEAMKMENPLKASRAGQIATIHTEKGCEVTAGALLITLREDG